MAVSNREVGALSHGIDLPEQVYAGMSASCPKFDSKGVCVFAAGASSVSAQFAVDVSERSGLLVTAVFDGCVPGWLGEGMDAVLISSPGCDQVMADAYDVLEGRGCRIHCIAFEGPLADICRRNGGHLVPIPSEYMRQGAAGFAIGALSRLLESVGFSYMRESLERALPCVKEYRDSLLESGIVVEISDRLRGKVPAVYSPIAASAAARRWKHSFGDVSFYGEMTEFNHNEIVGWADPNDHAPEMELVVLRMGTGIPQLEYAMDCMTEVLQEYGRGMTVVRFDDEDPVVSELKAMVLGDAVSARIRGSAA